jgi:hypothetical protein
MCSGVYNFARLDSGLHPTSYDIPVALQHWPDGIFHDLRFALRALGRDRGFTITATVVNTMLFRGW